MRQKSNVSRSRSEKSLKNAEQGVEDKLTIMTQMFWIAVSLLESDYEYEFLLATKLLDKVHTPQIVTIFKYFKCHIHNVITNKRLDHKMSV